MDAQVSIHGKVALIRISGRIVDGEPADDLKDTFQKILQQGRVATIVDVTEVTYFDSLAIGLLVAHYVSSTQRGGGVLLLGAKDRIRKMMQVVRLEKLFGWASTLDEALAWFETKGNRRT
jgi:anti-anti-sigma factor